MMSRRHQTMELLQHGQRLRHVFEGMMQHDQVELGSHLMKVSFEYPHAVAEREIALDERIDAAKRRKAVVAKLHQQFSSSAAHIEDACGRTELQVQVLALHPLWIFF